MNRIDQLFKFYEDRSANLEFHNVLRGFLKCLSSSEALELFSTALANDHPIKYEALNRLCDSDEVVWSDDLYRYIESLLSKLFQSKGRERDSVASALTALARVIPNEERLEICRLFLEMPYVSVRRRGYKLWTVDKILIQEMRRAWHKYQDPDCGWVIIKNFPVDVLIEMRGELINEETELWKVGRLYARISEVAPELAIEVRNIDLITYCYVLAKSGLTITESEAISILNASLNDSRIGLLIWAFGELRMWNVLKEVSELLPVMDEMHVERLRNQYR
jgi:hypothetical protein